MQDVNTKRFITIKALRQMKFPESDWVVEGLLRTGRRRPSLLVARPETGKSTLARQLAVAVSQGRPFLGRSTTRGAVIFWQTEDEVKDVVDSMNRLGTQDDDEDIHVFQGDPGSSDYHDLAAVIEEAGNVRLVIIETLDDLLKLDDVKENTAARVAFESFKTELMGKFADTTAFLALHHLKKAETSFARDAVLGASTIIGRTDAKIFLEQASPDDERRVIHSSKRVGTAIPKTYLVFNPITGRSELGETVSAAAITAKTAEYRAARQKLLDVLAQDPGIEHGALLDRLEGK